MVLPLLRRANEFEAPASHRVPLFRRAKGSAVLEVTRDRHEISTGQARDERGLLLTQQRRNSA